MTPDLVREHRRRIAFFLVVASTDVAILAVAGELLGATTLLISLGVVALVVLGTARGLGARG